ncbi:tyrosine-type recombinase/integrase [Aeromonas hydrophila]
MAELFYFDTSIFNHLHPVERAQFKELLKKNIIPNGRPFFLDSNNLPDRELDGFCNYLLSPRRGSVKTWKTYASQVGVFIRFMAAQGKPWLQATKRDLDLYYIVRTSGEYQNQPALTGRSWNVAKTAIVHLYEYAVDEGLINEVPFKYRQSRVMFGGKGINTADIGTKFTPEPINFISVNNYQQLWRPLISNGENSQRNIALVDTLIVSGLRISEALNLDVYQIPDPDDLCFSGLKGVKVRVVGKGKKSRYILIPKRIARAIRFYCDEERTEVLKQAKSRSAGKASSNQSTKIFLSRTGQPLSVRTVESFFTRMSKKTGIRLTPHGCRHTYAVYQLEAMIKKMSTNLKVLREGGADAYRQILNDPLRELQRLLGHSQITSTHIYLDFLEESEALVDESLDDWTSWKNDRM